MPLFHCAVADWGPALGELLDAAPVVSNGIGGKAVRLDVEGVPVFVKRVPLTDLERRQENVRSSANIFDLPCSATTGSVSRPAAGLA